MKMKKDLNIQDMNDSNQSKSSINKETLKSSNQNYSNLKLEVKNKRILIFLLLLLLIFFIIISTLIIAPILIGNIIINSQRDSLIDLHNDLSDSLSDKHLENLKESTSKFSISKYEIALKKGQSVELFYAIRNIFDTETNFKVIIEPIVSGQNEMSQKELLDSLEILSFDSEKNIKPSKVEVGRIMLKIINESVFVPSLYPISLKVINEDGSEYDSKNFVITVS